MSSFYKDLHSSLMTGKVDSNVLTLTKPLFPCFQEELFEEINKKYGVNILKVVTEVVQDQVEDVIILIYHILPELCTTLGR